MGLKFGNSSKERRDTCHKDLILILDTALSLSNVDFGISEGHRTIQKQQEYYAIGRTTELHRKPITNVDGVNKKGKHNYKPSLAADIYIWHSDKSTRREIAYDKVHISYVAGIIDTAAKLLYKQGKTSHTIRWGGNWDRDGVIAFDQSFDDLPHFELIKP